MRDDFKRFRKNGYKMNKLVEVKDFSFDTRAIKGNNYFYIVNIEKVDKNDILAYLDEMIYDLTSNLLEEKATAYFALLQILLVMTQLKSAK